MSFYSQHSIPGRKKWLCCCKRYIMWVSFIVNQKWYCTIAQTTMGTDFENVTCMRNWIIVKVIKMERSVNVKSSLLRNTLSWPFAFVACHAWMKVLHSQGSRKASVSVVYFLNPSSFVIFDVRSKIESL